MSEIKEIVWNVDNLSSLTKSILEHKKLEFIPKWFDRTEFIKLKTETRQFLSNKFNEDFNSKPITANGHQPDFQHPGIIFKDILISKLARLTGGLPLHVVVDTDHFEMTFTCPEKLEGKFAHLKTLHFKDLENRIYSQSKLSLEDKNKLIATLEKQLEEAKYFLNPKIQPEFKKMIVRKLELLKNSHSLIEVNETMREEFYKSRSIHLNRIRISELVELESFRVLVNKIKENLDEFRNVHNKALAEYRREHRIKNHAQPIPDLVKGEMPFWILDPVSKNRNIMRIEDSLDNVCILPKAVTLTMFLRLFMSDFFIHGKGGGRYEEVSEEIIKEFFQMEATPYQVASATMNLKKTEWFDVPDIDENGLASKLRDTIYSPENFLENTHPLAKQKKELIQEFKSRTENRKEIHDKISSLNEQMANLIVSEREKLIEIKGQLPPIQNTNQVFQSRILPFYYYNIDELIDYVDGL